MGFGEVVRNQAMKAPKRALWSEWGGESPQRLGPPENGEMLIRRDLRAGLNQFLYGSGPSTEGSIQAQRCRGRGSPKCQTPKGVRGARRAVRASPLSTPRAVLSPGRYSERLLEKGVIPKPAFSVAPLLLQSCYGPLRCVD